MFAKFLVPLDGSALAEKALPYASFLARRAHGRLVLVRAVDEELQTQAEAALKGAAARLRIDGIEADWSVVLGDASSAIELAATRYEVDAVVMSTQSQINSHVGYGSTAENVLRICGRPVLLVPLHCTRDWKSDTLGTVLVPLDGSQFAETALEPAVTLAHLLGTSLTLVQVVEPPASALLGTGPLDARPSIDLQEWMDEVQPYGQHVLARLRRMGVSAATEILTGFPAAAIAQLADHRGAAAIALATHGRTGLNRVVMGSTAGGIVQRATTPVLLVRPHAADLVARPEDDPAEVVATA